MDGLIELWFIVWTIINAAFLVAINSRARSIHLGFRQTLALIHGELDKIERNTRQAQLPSLPMPTGDTPPSDQTSQYQ